MSGILYPDATPDVSFTYRRDGQFNQITDAVGTRTFAYNSYLEHYRETLSGLYTERIYRKLETSPVPGRDRGLYTYEADYDVTYGFEPATGRISSVASLSTVLAATRTFQYSYLAGTDLVSGVTEPTSGVTLARHHEPDRDLVTLVQNSDDANLIAEYKYRYDPVGVRTSVVNQGSAFVSGSRLNLWEYDDRYELSLSDRRQGTDPHNPGSRVPEEYREYLYDNIGNRQSMDVGDPPSTTTYTILNLLNQYDGTTNPAESFLYDEDGNMTEDGTFTYGYDAENRLVSAVPKNPVSGSKKVEYTYDYMGRRVERKVYTYSGGRPGSPSERTKYVWHGWQLILELDGLAANDDKAAYTWGLDLSGTLQGAGGIGGLLMGESRFGYANQVVAYGSDGNGNVTEMFDLVAGGSLAGHYEYDPYGNVLQAPSGHWNSFRFSTKQLDAVTGLYYYGYRYQSPRLGRWLTRDPIEEAGGTNLYGFVANQPTMKIDGLGTGYWTCCDHCNLLLSRPKITKGGVSLWPAQLAGSPESVHDAHVLLDDVNVLGLLTSVPGSWSELAGKLFEQLLEWGWHGRIGEALDKVRKRQARNADRVVIYVYFEWDACTLTPCFTLWGNKLHADWTHREGWHKCSAYLRSNVPGFEEGVDPRRTDLVLAIARCLVEAMRMMVR